MEPVTESEHIEQSSSGYENIKTKNEILTHLIKKLPSKIPKKSKDRVIFFLKAMNRDTIDMTALKVIAFRGIPDEVRSLRGVVWRLLLNYLPNKPSKWIETINENKKQYESFMEELIIKPQISMEETVGGSDENGRKQVADHPLSVSEESVWAQFHKDREIWEEIEKDVKRTRNETALFMRALKDEDTNKNWDRLLRQAELKKSELNAEDREKYIETHGDVLSRILFIYAKLNPGIRYVQGMNEILALLYFVFFDTTDPILIESLESDLFF
jgi:TBC1 domain family member 13